MREAKSNASCREQIIPTAELASQTQLGWSEISEKYNSAIGEGDASRRVHELWRDIRPVEWPIRVRSAVAGRCFIAQIDPRFSSATVHAVRNLLIRCAPGQPHRVHGHPRANLSLADECLVSRREALIHLRML